MQGSAFLASLTALLVISQQILSGDLVLVFTCTWILGVAGSAVSLGPLNKYRLWHKISPHSLQLTVAIVLVILLAFLQSAFSEHFSRSFSLAVRILTLFVFWHYLTRQLSLQRRSLFFLSILLLMLFQSCGGFWQVFIDTSREPLSWAQTPGIEPGLKRAFGLYDDPNLFGSALGMVLIGLLQSHWVDTRTRLVTTTSLVLTLSLVLTQSRGALLGVVAALILMMFWSRIRRLTLILLLLLISGVWWTGRGQTLVLKDLGVNQRVELIKGSLKYAVEQLPWGSGPGTFHLYYPRYRTVGGYYPLYAHNFFLEILCEQGLPGLLTSLAVALFALRLWWRSKALPLLAFMLLSSQVGHAYSLFSQWAVFLICLSVITGKSNVSLKRGRQFHLMGLGVILFVMEVLRVNAVEQISNNPWLWQKFPAYVQMDLASYSQVADRVINAQSPEAFLQGLKAWGHLLTVKYSEEPEIYASLGEIALLRKNWAEAGAYYYRALSLDPFSEDYVLGVVRGHYRQGKFLDCIRLVRQSLLWNPQYRRVNPLYDALQVHLILSLLRLGRKDEAKQVLAEAVWVNEDYGKDATESLTKEM